MPQKNAARLTSLLLLAAMQVNNYCFNIFRASQTISETSLQKDHSVVPGRIDMELLDNLHRQYMYAAKIPSNDRVYVGLTSSMFNETVRS